MMTFEEIGLDIPDIVFTYSVDVQEKVRQYLSELG